MHSFKLVFATKGYRILEIAYMSYLFQLIIIYCTAQSIFDAFKIKGAVISLMLEWHDNNIFRKNDFSRSQRENKNLQTLAPWDVVEAREEFHTFLKGTFLVNPLTTCVPIIIKKSDLKLSVECLKLWLTFICYRGIK